ncbi:MAG: DUF421 domain-containing protein, partial [Gemmatimonadaceae bacterium]|nr:DUF421 domain-containing protein [Gemmatimonadaceae bacterium]
IDGASALVILNSIGVRVLYTHPTIARWLEGDADVLIERGKLHDVRLKRELITRGELEAAARRQGIEGLHQVETCRLEVGGALTFVPRAPTDDEKRHRELLEHLVALEESQASLVTRLGALERQR